MSKQLEEMKSFLSIYFDMDYDLFGEDIDSIAKYYVYEGDLYFSNILIDDFKEYLRLHSDDTNDVFFKKTFDYCYLYTDDYANSVEFLRDVLSKLIFYRDQRLKEEAAAKGK